MLKSPPLVATLSDSMRMSPCSWDDIFTWPLRGDRIIGLRHPARRLCTLASLCYNFFCPFRDRLIGRTSAFGAEYPGSSPGPGTKFCHMPYNVGLSPRI